MTASVPGAPVPSAAASKSSAAGAKPHSATAFAAAAGNSSTATDRCHGSCPPSRIDVGGDMAGSMAARIGSATAMISAGVR